MTEYVYGLYTNSGDKKNYFYVGVTTDHERRFVEHKSPSASDMTARAKYIRELNAKGIPFDMDILETIHSGAHSYEDLWIVNLDAQGHKLLNSKGGDQDRYIPSGAANKYPPLTLENFCNAKNWRAGGMSKPGEKYTKLGYWTIYRTGWRQTRLYRGPVLGWIVTKSMFGREQLFKNLCIDLGITGNDSQH